jgi:hypothetical protein
MKTRKKGPGAPEAGKSEAVAKKTIASSQPAKKEASGKATALKMLKAKVTDKMQGAAPPAPPPAAAKAKVETTVEVPSPIAVAEKAVRPIVAASRSVAAAAPADAASAFTGLLQPLEISRTMFEQAQEAGRNLKDAVAASATATASGWMELNSKVLDLVGAQRDASISLCQRLMQVRSMSDAIDVPRQMQDSYAGTTARFMELTETASRMVERSVEPMRSAFAPR